MNRCDKCDTDNFDRAKYCSGCGYELPEKINENANTPIQDTKPTKKKQMSLLIGAVVGLLAMFGAQYAVKHLFFKKPTIDTVMMQAASELNKSCPIMIDSETRLDNTITFSNIFQYNYTLMSVEKEFMDTLVVKSQIEPGLINYVRTNPDMKYIRDNDVIVNYSYKDVNGAYLFKISVTPTLYK